MTEAPLDTQKKAEATPQDDVPDELLMMQIGSGSRPALSQLYERHSRCLLGCARRILHNRNDAEDLLHDLFIEVWQRADSFDPQRGKVLNWMMLRLRCRAIDRLRVLAAARQRALATAIPDEQPAPVASDPCHDMENALTRKSVCILSDAQRSVLELGYFEGLTCAEIAGRCGIPIGTVKSRLSAALNNLRRYHAKTGGRRDAH